MFFGISFIFEKKYQRRKYVTRNYHDGPPKSA